MLSQQSPPSVSIDAHRGIWSNSDKNSLRNLVLRYSKHRPPTGLATGTVSNASRALGICSDLAESAQARLL
jgi:hypothetical protein